MVRTVLSKQRRPELFRRRGKEILRIEALSDAVFAFAVSLLAVALEVPETFDELAIIFAGAIPFFATVALLFLFWYQQYIFFRHYALEDLYTTLLNMAYLALILFYLYPLKFLFSLLLGSWLGINFFPEASARGLAVILPEDFSILIIVFSVGYALLWSLLWLMHRHALGAEYAMPLNTAERKHTVSEKRGAAMNVLIGLAAILFAVLRLEWLAGICYLLIPLALWLNARIDAAGTPKGRQLPK